MPAPEFPVTAKTGHSESRTSSGPLFTFPRESSLVLLRMKITSGGEVKWAGMPDTGAVYYGGPPVEPGIWKLKMAKIENYFELALRERSYGDSIETFVLGFEIGNLERWGNFFTSMSCYTSYWPKIKLIISVGQINWLDVKDLSATEQFKIFSRILLKAISRVGDMKRRLKNFDFTAFSADIENFLTLCPVGEIV